MIFLILLSFLNISVAQVVLSNNIPVVPNNVHLLNGNRTEFYLWPEGLVINSRDSVTQTNAAGQYNGSGTGQKAFVAFDKYDNMPFSDFEALEFTARYNFDNANNTFGYITWNALGNFNNGSLPLATDFVNLVWDDQNNHLLVFIASTTNQTWSIDENSRAWKAVNGTGTITFTGNTTAGSNVVTSVNIPAALTAGMWVKKQPAATPDTGNPIPDGTTIVSIDVGASTITLSANATDTQSSISFRQYGGVAPVNRTGSTTSGNATITGITNTADLQVSMIVSGTGIPANTRILSMVANTSITLSANATETGTPTLSFRAAGLTGIPANTELVGVPMSRIAENNPNGYFANTRTDSGVWTTADGGFLKNWKHPAFNFIVGTTGTSARDPRQVVLKNVRINDDVYVFGN